MAGRNPTVLIDTSVSWPNGLAIDFDSQQMYWIDAHKETIESADLYGNDRKIIYEDPRESDPFGLTIQGAYIYWTDWAYKGVFRITQDGRNKTVVHDNLFRGLNDIKFFNRSALRGRNACSGNNGGCSHFCLAVPNSRVCGCPVEYHIGADGKTCQTVETCPQEVPNGRIDPACHRQYNASCSFVCNMGFTATVKQKMRCTQDMTWSLSINTLCVDRVCPILPTPSHATVDRACPLVGYPGVTCHHSCNHLYKTAGGSTSRTCTKKLYWTGSALTCQQIQCPVLNTTSWPNTVLHPAVCSHQPAPPSETCAQSCQSGYLPLGGSIVLACQDNGMWNGTLSQCVLASDITTVSSSGDADALTGGTVVTTPMIIGIVVACVALVLIIVLVAVLVTRRQAKRSAQYRDSPNLNRSESTRSTDFHYPSNGNSPTYDVRSDRVDLHGNPMSFSNPGYESIDGINAGSQQANGGKGAGPLPEKNPIEADVTQATDPMAFDNPLYIKDKEKKAQVDAVNRALEGEIMPLDLTRELSNA